jgi:hypothetical protein
MLKDDLTTKGYRVIFVTLYVNLKQIFLCL